MRSILNRITLVIACICLLLGAGVRASHAQPYRDIAKVYSQAEKLYKERKFAAARAAYLRAYTIRPEPLLLYSVAQTYRYEGKLEQAIEYYKRYLDTAPPDPMPRGLEATRKKARGHMTVLRSQLAARKALATRKARAEPVSNTAPTHEAKPAANPADPKPVRTPVTSATDPLREDADVQARVPAPGPTWKRKAAWIALGTGGVGLAAVAVFGSLGLSAESKHRDDPLGGHGDAVERYQTLTNVSLVVAGIGLVSGGVLYWLSRTASGEQRSSSVAGVGLVPTARGAQAVVRFEF